jgi:hypothetical protein
VIAVWGFDGPKSLSGLWYGAGLTNTSDSKLALVSSRAELFRFKLVSFIGQGTRRGLSLRPSVEADAVEVVAVAEDGQTATAVVDTAKCLPRAVVFERKANMIDRRRELAAGVTVDGDTRTVRTDVSDYRSFNGVLFATRSINSVNGQSYSEEDVENVEINPDLPATYFSGRP